MNLRTWPPVAYEREGRAAKGREGEQIIGNGIISKCVIHNYGKDH